MQSPLPLSRQPRVEIRESSTGRIARINDVDIPIVDFAVQTDSGTPMLSLILTPGSLSIGDASAGAAALAPRDDAPRVAAWGDTSHPDPRESIPGWSPETLAGQIAANAERVTLRTWEPSEGQGRRRHLSAWRVSTTGAARAMPEWR